MLGKDTMQEENAGIISDDRQTSKECDTADCILSLQPSLLYSVSPMPRRIISSDGHIFASKESVFLGRASPWRGQVHAPE
jgi:hypothetical protein